MSVTVRKQLDSVKVSLQEDTDSSGIFWSNEELVDNLNQAYDWLLGLNPEEFVTSSVFSCAAGTLQTLPDGAVSLVNIPRNNDGSKRSLRQIGLREINSLNRDWHDSPASTIQKYWIYDNRDRTHFYVWPPASAGSELQLITVGPVGDRHVENDYDNGTTKLHTDERFNQAIKHYILFLCYEKNSEYTSNRELAQVNFNRAHEALGLKVQNEARISPNNPTNKEQS